RAGRVGAAFATGCALAAAPIWRLLRDDPWSNATRIRRFEWARGARSTSYVLMAGNVPEDGAADMHERGRERYVRRLVAGTRRRRAAGGGLIGLHGSFVASVTPGRIAEERADLVKLVGDGVGDHRFHYLRHRPDRAWPELAAAGLTSDASLGYAEQPGFRAGTAHPFRAWHHEEDHVLDLVVLPLAFMDASLDPRYLDLGPTGSGEALALRALERIREVGGSASILFHNDRLCCVDSRPWTRLYGRLLDTTRAGGGTACTAHDAATRYRATLPPWLLA
ncbi:MAG: hypothetical protein JWM90_2925, partial [Thermoleophilia bacterium]|nr:hypothetical protein [Thermoleophilia bacterium]